MLFKRKLEFIVKIKEGDPALAGLKLEPNTDIGEKDSFRSDTRSHLKNWILVQGQGGPELQPAGILKYSEELKRVPNTETCPLTADWTKRLFLR